MDEQIVDEDFGTWLKEKRISRAMLIKELSAKTGISHFRLDQLERGMATRGITVVECNRLATALNIPVTLIRARACGKVTDEKQVTRISPSYRL